MSVHDVFIERWSTYVFGGDSDMCVYLTQFIFVCCCLSYFVAVFYDTSYGCPVVEMSRTTSHSCVNITIC